MAPDIGADCPDCGRRLHGPTCACGWRSKPSDTELKYRCDDCDTPTRLVQLMLGQDGREDEDGKLRCASCHVEYLRQRALKDPLSPDEFVRCKAQLEDAYRRAGEKWDTKRL